MKTVITWVVLSLTAMTAGGLVYWKITSRMQIQIMQVQERPPIDEAAQRLLDEARQPLDTTGKANGQILHLQ